MRPEEADVLLAQINDLAWKIEMDEELSKIDERYRITAKWIDTNIDNVSL